MIVKTELKAKDVMTSDPVTVGPATKISELARVLGDHEISGAPVVDQQGRVIGVVSKTDLIRRCAQGINDIPPACLFEVLCEQDEDDGASQALPEPLVCVGDFMTEDPLTVTPEISARTIGGLMADRRVHRVIVVDEESFPIGIITSLDLLRALSA
jgi:CBS domain-containing protein